MNSNSNNNLNHVIFLYNTKSKSKSQPGTRENPICLNNNENRPAPNKGAAKRKAVASTSGAKKKPVKTIVYPTIWNERLYGRKQYVKYVQTVNNYHRTADDKILFRWPPESTCWVPWTYIAASKLTTKNGQRIGKGLFADRDFKKFDVIGHFSGKHITKNQYRTAKAQAAKNGIEGEMDKILPIDVQVYTNSNAINRGVSHVDARNTRAKHAGYIQFVNDPYNTNKHGKPNSVLFGEELIMYAMKPIKQGEEILWNYGAEYWNNAANYVTVNIPNFSQVRENLLQFT